MQRILLFFSFLLRLTCYSKNVVALTGKYKAFVMQPANHESVEFLTV